MTALHYYWRALSVCTSYDESMMGAAKILRKFGQSSRLFQLVTRWQSILRIRRGEQPISPHVYLHGWQLKSELSHKAKAYDNCSTLLFGNRCGQASSKKKIAAGEELTNKWTRQTSNKTKYHTMKQCKVQQKLHKQRPTTPLMVQHFLD
ncbi:hypothetical protein Zmor_000116 [Zophobas morio]|uniref:Uncharacterized protein n=2 Tax=Zophobas morio TaxID=2755281 RepID=A0AA38J4T2_9CUCU|nr:hypothetical protein Zmor_000116 [Zophobas morio]